MLNNSCLLKETNNPGDFFAMLNLIFDKKVYRMVISLSNTHQLKETDDWGDLLSANPYL